MVHKNASVQNRCKKGLVTYSSYLQDLSGTRVSLSVLLLTVREVKVMHMPPNPFIARAKKIRMDRSAGERLP